MKNSKLTNKQIKTNLDEIYKILTIINDKTFQLETLFILYLKWNNEEEKFSKFVKKEIDKVEQSRLEDKEGA